VKQESICPVPERPASSGLLFFQDTGFEQIRTLNDRLRQNLGTGVETAVITIGVAALGDEAVARIVKTIAAGGRLCNSDR
jgi:hypothetical protein